jgi:hypothetical protein
MTSRRNLLIGAVGLVKGKVRDDGKAMLSICNELEPYFKSHRLLHGAPFSCISLILRYGTTTSERPEIGKIDERHSELHVAYELPINDLRLLDYDKLRARLREATIESLVAIARKFGLPVEIWEGLKEP